MAIDISSQNISPQGSDDLRSPAASNGHSLLTTVASSKAKLDEPRQNGAGENREEALGENQVPDLAGIEKAIRSMLLAVGENPDRDGLLETPKRVARMYAEMFRGLHVDASRHLEKTFEVECGEIVLIRDIEFTSMCEHHLLPFSGNAHVAYIPQDKVAGLSKFARVIEDVARRPQVQERMTNQIADAVNQKLNTSGVAVVIQAEHSCMAIRGIRKRGSTTVTSALRGIFKTNPASRAEVMSLINQS